MKRKREEARIRASEARARAGETRARAGDAREETRARVEEAEAESARAAAEAETKDQIRDVIAGLRNLQIGASDARRAEEATLSLRNPTLEERMRAALQQICPRRTYRPSDGSWPVKARVR
jgi:hypothetical protein